MKLLAEILMVRADRRSWVPAVFWGTAGSLSLMVAMVLAVQPDRLGDLREVRSWLAALDDPGVQPYLRFAGKLDYPPVALLLLWPLILIPDAALAAWFLPSSVVVTMAAGWVFVRAIAERLYTTITWREQFALVGMLFSSSGVRTALWVGQTLSLAVLAGALALLWSRRRPYAAACALAVCSFKPHLALGFGLAILLLDGLTVPLLAAAMVTSLSLLMAAIVDQSLLDMAVRYLTNLTVMYGDEERVRGLLSIRWVIEDVVGHFGAATGLYLLAAAGTLVMAASAARQAVDSAERTQVIAIILLWPVLFLPSQLYNSVLAAPALWLLMWPEGRLLRGERTRMVVVAVLLLISVLDVPRLLRAAAAVHGDLYWLFQGSYFLDPLRMTVLFTVVAWALTRRARRRVPGGPA